jgi:hypothetical protein
MRVSLLFLVAGLVVACSGSPPDSLQDSEPSADIAPSLQGVPDRGHDPAVVLLEAGAQGPCAGALLAQDVVLTARRCLEITQGDLACPAKGRQIAGPLDLTNVQVLVGDDVASAVVSARGRGAVFPAGDELCGDDIALLLLDTPIEDIAPLVVDPMGAPSGDHVRSVAFTPTTKIVRDHVPVPYTDATEIELAEAPCVASPGGVAIDETSGEVVGIVSRGGPSCGAAPGWEIATRPDAYYDLVEQALAMGSMSHASHMAKETKGPVDMGATCTDGSACAAGVCVTYEDATYCSRECSSADACPTDWRCMTTVQSTSCCAQE